MFVYILKREIGYDSERLCSSSLCYDNFYAKIDTGDKIKCSSIPKNTETHGKIIKRMLKRLLRLIKKDFLIDTSEDIRNKKCHSSLLADFKIGDKNMKTFLKGE